MFALLVNNRIKYFMYLRKNYFNFIADLMLDGELNKEKNKYRYRFINNKPVLYYARNGRILYKINIEDVIII